VKRCLQTLRIQMSFFDDYDILGGLGDLVMSGVNIVADNPVKALAITAATLATGGVALACAPAIGAAVSAAGIGVAGGTLTGAAASSAGLAALGGGSIAVGGAGMAGGTAVVAVTGAAVGGATSGAASTYL